MIRILHDLNEFQNRIAPEYDVLYSWKASADRAGALPAVRLVLYAYGVLPGGITPIIYEDIQRIHASDVRERSGETFIGALCREAQVRVDLFTAKVKIMAADLGCRAIRGRLQPEGEAVRSALADLLEIRLNHIIARLDRLEAKSSTCCHAKAGDNGDIIIT